MRNKALWFVFILVLLVFCANAYAYTEVGMGDTTQSQEQWRNFWDSFGGFVYNIMPWNWGNWVGGSK
jgi:hypothetical protein